MLGGEARRIPDPAAAHPPTEVPMPDFDPERVRPRFPALATTVAGRPAVFLDGPGGTQVPEPVIEAVSAYYREANSNTGGAFLTSRRTDETIAAARAALGAFLNAPSPAEIKFAANMTSHTFAVSRAVGATLEPGDEVVVTTLDHEANVSPWAALAERGVVVRTVDIRPEDCTLDLGSLDRALGPRTRVVAVGYASNAVGTVNDVEAVCARARAVGAISYVDAVHFAPHGAIDVQRLGCDALVCSTYKFFGPHLGVLWMRPELLERLPAYKVRPAEDRVELGTLNHEGLAGAAAAVGYLEAIGLEQLATVPAAGAEPGPRRALEAAMAAIARHESGLGRRLLEGLDRVGGVRVYGIRDPGQLHRRVPTVAITVAGRSPRTVAAALGAEGIFVWDGDFYAQALIERLGLLAGGGVVRLGLVHYNTAAEVDRTLAALERIAAPS
ncbi:MAG TPA: cysteine desulfurase-like protein [Candidatus Micrarchaeia archaeon]|nr:cysteine desulfurase-like protein [Candidatus Micrarchaeia archaeon]